MKVLLRREQKWMRCVVFATILFLRVIANSFYVIMVWLSFMPISFSRNSPADGVEGVGDF